MKQGTKKNMCIQAAVALILLVSTGVSAVHPTIESFSTSSDGVTSTFHFTDQPFITVSITPQPLTYGQRLFAGQEYATVELPGEGISTVVGQAKLPMISRFLEVPYGAVPSLVVESVTWETTSLDALQLPSWVIPVQDSLVKTEGATVPFTIDDRFYAQDSFLPSSFVEVSMIGELRGRNIAFLSVSPVQYNPSSGKLRIMTRCDVRIELPGSDLVKTAEQIDRYTTSSFKQLFSTSFVNYGALQGAKQNGLRKEGYLIIVHDSFVDAIGPFADWKDSLGFETTVTKTSEIPGGVTKEKIKSYIVDAYNNWTTPPAYVLLVGDVAQIPTWTGTQSSSCTDLYYATIDQGNYFADLIVSRFPAATVEHVTIMVDKTMYYEVGVFPDESWIKKAAFIASSDAGGMAEGTHNYVIDNYLTPNNYTCNKIYQSQGGSTSDITNALNDGRSLCVYSGHGYSGGWGCVPFDQSNVQNLQNYYMYPFVCSHACSTNPFNQGECFGETWLRTENKGGLAFWGASASTYWDEDDILEKRMFKAWWEDNLEMIGGMTNKGLLYLYEYYGGAGLTKYYFEAYNVLGDSSVKLWNGQTNINTPPNIPEKPLGPTTGEIGVEYSFTFRTTDAQNNDVYYMVYWGDEMTGWLGPYESGASIALNHSWTVVGDYSIKVKAKDTDDLESDWSEGASIYIDALPCIEIGEIAAGVGSVTAEIKNTGAGAASNVNWSIAIQGNLILLGRYSSGSFAKIMPGFAPKAKTGFVFGVGSVEIRVTVGELEKTATALLIGPFFLRVA